MYTSFHYGDLHFPFQDTKAVDTAMKILADLQPDLVVCHGDLVDCASISTYEKDPKHRASLAKEIEMAKTHLRQVSEWSPGARRILLKGNHEDRLRRLIWKLSEKSPAHEILNLPETEAVLDWPSLLRLNDFGWEWHEDKFVLFNRMILKHGTFVRKWSGQSAKAEMERYGKSGISGHCFDEETEILTPDGWKRHDELKVGDPVLTMDASADRDAKPLKWDIIQEVHRYTDFDELVHIKAHGLDLAVTGGHGLMVPRKGPSVGWKRRSADDAYGHEMRHFPLAGRHDQESLPLTDDQIRFIAWVMAEGNFDRGKYIRIAQSDYDGHCEALEATLEGIGAEYNKTLRYRAGETQHGTYRNYDAYRYSVPVKVYRDWLGTYLTADKTPTRALAGMSLHQMQVFLDTYVLADGCVNKSATHSRQIASNRKDHVDFLQELAVRSGHRSTVIERPDGMWCITINSRDRVKVRAGGWSREPYKGVVWCVSVANGTLVVRRNGRTAITANTHRQGAFVHRDWNGQHGWWEHGCLCTLNPTYTEDPDWQQGCCVVTWSDRRDYFSVELIHIHRGKAVFRGKLYAS